MFNRSIRTMSVLGISALLLLTVIGLASRGEIVAAAPAADDTPPTTNVIVVTGTGQVTVQPDQATISLGVQTTAPTLAAATGEASDTMSKVLVAIKAQGVDAKDIQTSNYTVNPISNSSDSQTPAITGYQVSNMVTITVRNLANVGKILDAGIGAGANSVGGVSFGVADPAAPQNEARTAAVKDAMQVAQTLAQAAGVTLGPVVTITDIANGVPQPLPAAVFAENSSGAGPVATGSLQVTSNVQVRFAIAQ